MAPLSVEELERFVQNALEAKAGQGGNTNFQLGREVVVGGGSREDLGGGFLKYVFILKLRMFGEDESQFDEHIVQIGWKHQLEDVERDLPFGPCFALLC